MVLASDPTATILAFSACGKQYVVFPWAFHEGTGTFGIWRMNAHGPGLRS
jgi:hypothetical protein